MDFKEINSVPALMRLLQQGRIASEHQEAFFARVRELQAIRPVRLAAGEVDGKYELRSWIGGVKPSAAGDGLVPCDLDDVDTVGTLALITRHGFQRANGSLFIKPMSEMKRYDENNQLVARELGFALGSWVLTTKVSMGLGGPTLDETFYGFIGRDRSTNGFDSFSVTVSLTALHAEKRIGQLVEQVIGQVWGFSSLEKAPDAAAETTVTNTIHRVGRFGIQGKSSGSATTESSSIVLDGQKVEQGSVMDRLRSRTRNRGARNSG